ncbi:uncharacterized protein LOC121378064 [Gigantopelta aegis]|uniref:uncharacterized protein LOC121378064 n=1 Tax=Gigantopelta aegis TaxID=1735272 RepID=UPI001B88C1C3|nr:uncharacterized protein LOC121378064 [Gigantopelta aegis]
MDETILFFLCIYWWSVYDPSLCQIVGNCKVTPESYTYSSHVNKLTELDKGIGSNSFWCSDGDLHNSWMDLYPHLVVNFGATKKTIVGLTLRGPSAAHKKYGFLSFQVYKYVDNGDFYDAIRENHESSRMVKTFTGLTAEDIENGQFKKHVFPYPVDAKKLKIYFKLRLAQKRVCMKIEFLQNCGRPLTEENKCDNAGCEQMCVKKNHTFHCTCPENKVLWLDGLRCVDRGSEVKITSKPRNIPYKAHEICTSVDSKLATIFNLKEYTEMKIETEKNGEDHFIGVVDVDYDQSYSRWIDGTDVVFDKFEETRGYPGSIGRMSGEWWIFKNSSGDSEILCRSGSEDGYLLTSFYGIEPDQLVSSPSLVKTSLASISAFDVKRSLRGLKAYLTTHSGEHYGLFWRPKYPTMTNKFLEVILKDNEIEITGVVVIGYRCTSSTIKYRLRKNRQPLGNYKFSVPAHSEKLQFVDPSIKARRIGVQLDDSADCEGYKWDLVGQLKGLNGTSLMHSAWHDGSWVDFALFEGTVPEHTNEEQVVFMDSNLYYMWSYGPASTTQACVVCQYRQPDCTLPILTGPWKIPKSAWKTKGFTLDDRMLNNIKFDLPSGLQYFETNTADSYIQVDLQRQFHLHLMKCSSKTEDPDSRYFNLDISEWIEQNFKPIKEYDCGAPYEMKEHIISPSIKARRIQIKWKESRFTLKVELFGCPSEPLDGKNPQCGTAKMSFYHVTEGDRMYECVYKFCSPSVYKTTCSSYPYYYQTLDECDSQDACHSFPCNMGEICVQYQTNHGCYCLKPPCGIQSGIDIMLNKHKVSLFDTVRVYIVIKPEDVKFEYTVEIGDLICRLDFKPVTNYLCSKFMYKTTKGGTLKAIVKKHMPTKIDTSKSHTFTVTLPEPMINSCFKDIQISGNSNTDFNKPVYSTVNDNQFTLSNERGCDSAFKIMKYKWTFSRFESDTYNFCINDYSFKVMFSLSTNNGVLVVKKQKLLDGYFKVCLQVDGEVYSEVNVTCGYFRVKTVPFEVVIKPPGLHQTVLNTRRVRLDASDSKDPNSGDNSGLSYEWKCKPVNSSQNVCHFGSRRNMFPHNGPILEIPENTLPDQKTFKITVSVGKPGIPGVTASVIIFVTSETRPKANITCNLNCNTNKVIPSKHLALEVNCGNCGPFGVVISAHLWKLSKQTDLLPMKILPLADWVSKLPTGYNKKSMVLPPGTLNASSTYQFDLHIFYNKNASKVKLEYRFRTNQPPEGGSCSVDPTSGQALITKFTVSCPGYKDNDSPLTYNVFLNKKGKSDTLLYQGNGETTSLVLPAGPPQSNSWLQLTVYISDSLDTSTNFTLRVKKQECIKGETSKYRFRTNSLLKADHVSVDPSLASFITNSLCPVPGYKDQ